MRQAKDIDLNLLVVFQEVYQERQISSVARHLGLSQPAVSNALARLRRHFEDELFVRTAAGMQPTALAEQLSEPIAVSLSHITQALNRQPSFDPNSSERRFALALTDVGEVYFLPRLVNLIAQAAPGVKITSVRAGEIDLKTEMEAGRVDLALGAFDHLSESWYQRRLFKQNYVCLVRKEHIFARQGMTLKEFVQAKHLIVAEKDRPYDKINQHLEKAGVAIKEQIQVPHFMAVPYIISQQDLIVTVPQKLGLTAATPFDLMVLKPPLRLPSIQTNMFWHRRYNQDAGNQWIRNFISDHFLE